jgi:tetratricopeptide (TPR) repeat protein
LSVRLLSLLLVVCVALTAGCEKKSAFDLTNEGLALVKSGRSGAALRRFEAAIRADPKYPFGYYYAAGLYNEAGKWNRAEKYLHKTIELRPDYANAYYTLGFVLENRAKHLVGTHSEGIDRTELRDLSGAAFARYAEDHPPPDPADRHTLEDLLRRSHDAYVQASERGIPVP